MKPGRHDPGDGPFARRSPDARRAGVAHGQRLQLRPLQDGARAGRGASTSTRCAAWRSRRGRKIVLCGYTSYPRDYDYSAFQGDRRRGRRADHGRRVARRRADRSRVSAQPVRRRLRRRDHDDAQEPARAARRDDALPRKSSPSRSTSRSFPGCRAGRT